MTRPLRPGEYWYVRRRTMWAEGAAGDRGIQPEVREDWVGIDGSRHWRTRPLGQSPSAGSDHQVGPSKLPPFYDGATRVTYAELLALPRDPEALYRRLRAAAVKCECGNSVDEETFVIAGDLLRDNPIPVDLRAAILRAAALVPGIELTHGQRDVAGRPGVGVAFDAPGRRSVLIFDPKTHELLGENEGIGGSADIESGIVDSLSARP